MNFLRIADIPDNRTGGMSRYMHFVTDELRASGHHVDLLFHNDIPCRVGGRLRRLALHRAVVRLVTQRLRQGQEYDAVDLHEQIAAGYALARKFNSTLPPLITCVYALEARGREAMNVYLSKKTLLSPWWRGRGLATVWLANVALRNSDHITVETGEDADYLRSRLRIPADRVSFLYGAPSPVFFCDDEVAQRNREGVLFAASWIERKGVLDLIPAVSRMLRKYPELPVTLTGVGVLSETVRAGLPAEIRSKVHILPSITDDRELARLMWRHRVFLLPSVFEGLPLALLEAAAARLAVVATNTCGMKDFIRHGQNGFVVEVGNAEALAAHASRLVEDPSLAARLGAAAQDTAREFTWRRSAEQFLAAATAAKSRGRKWPCGV
jgi:glycosyltransferase involved in cell wall biosynthesis